MKSNACRNTRREIDELEIGQQPGRQALAHLAVCPECAAFRRERAELRGLASSLAGVVAPPDFEVRLRARMAAERRSERRLPFFARLISTPVLATAAAVVLTVGAVAWVAQRTSDQSSGPAANSSAPESATQGTKNAGNVDIVAPPPISSASDGDKDLVAVGSGKRSGYKSRGSSRAAGTSADFNVQPANLITQNDPNQAFVNAPSKSVEVSLENDRGATRKISLPPVSFGAQNLVNNREPVTHSANSRIW